MTSIKMILSVILILAILSFTNAQPGPKGDMHKGNKEMGMHGDMLKHMKSKLKLTDDQVSKIKDLSSIHMKKMVDLRADLKKSMIDLKDIRKKDSFTRQDVIAGVEKTNKIKNDIALATANHLMDIWEILTPEQQKIVKENPQLFMGARKHWRMDKRY